jgi:hypothetical protein
MIERLDPRSISRTKVREVPCPVCRATNGQRCFTTRGRPRESNHLERVEKRLGMEPAEAQPVFFKPRWTHAEGFARLSGFSKGPQ